MKASPINASDLIDAYDFSIRQSPEAAVRMVMWLMVYDQRSVAWVHEFLETAGVLEKAADEKARSSQRRKLHRWRVAAEKSTGLPPRGKKGCSDAYRTALAKWRVINPRPSKEQLLAGWVPTSIEAFAEETPATLTPTVVTELGASPAENASQSYQNKEPRRRGGNHQVPDFGPADFKAKSAEPLKVVVNRS